MSASSSPADRSTLYERFYSAARAGDADSLAILLAATASPGSKLELLNWQHVKNHEQTSLHDVILVTVSSLYTASKYGKLAAVQFLLEQRGVRADLADDQGYSPVHIAAQEGHDKVLLCLLEARPSLVDLKTELGHTPLFVACISARARCVVVLLSSGASADEADHTGFSPAMAAASANSPACLKALSAHQVNLEALSVRGAYSALHVAAARGHSRAVECLLRLGCRGSMSSQSPVDLALQNGHQMVARTLLKTQGILLPAWKPLNHHLYPDAFKKSAYLVLLVFVRLRNTPGHVFRGLPKEIVHLVIIGLAEGYRQEYRDAPTRVALPADDNKPKKVTKKRANRRRNLF